MKTSKDLSTLSFRLLGYYNNPGQFLKEETEDIALANELSILLKQSFTDIEDVNHDKNFEDALINGVFVMRDRESNLYAYWPKNQIVRVSDVIYNKDEITVLPLEYKYWFTPGETIQIGKFGDSALSVAYQKTLMEHLRAIDSIGRTVRIMSDFMPGKQIAGELLSIGKDFFAVRDELSAIHYITNHFCIDFPASEVNRNKNSIIYEEDEVLPPMGVITQMNTKGLGYIKTLPGSPQGGGVLLGLRKVELLDMGLSIGSTVVYSTRTEHHKNGTTMEQAISVHSASSTTICISLAKELVATGKHRQARDVLQHILDVYPDNQEALVEQVKIPQSKQNGFIAKDEDTLIFNNACEMVVSPDTAQKAINDLVSLLNKNKKVKDCISRILLGYYILYNNENDEETKNVYRKQLSDFLEENHSKLSPSASLNTRLNYYNKLGMDKEYLDTLNSVLQNPQTDISKRAKMLYLKAIRYINSGKEDEAINIAKESLYHMPLNNKAEMIINRNSEYPLTSNVISNRYITKIITGTPIDASIIDSSLVSKQDPQYLSKLLVHAKDNNNDALEYISCLAQNIAANAEDLDSPVFLWNQVFSSIDVFGYFAQDVFTTMLSCVLNVPLAKDDRLQWSLPWENKKTWQEVIDFASYSITRKQWGNIFAVINNNDYLVKELHSHIILKEDLKDSLERLFNIVYGPDELSRIISESFSEVHCEEASKVLSKPFAKKMSLLDQYTALNEIDWNEDSLLSLTGINRKILDIFRSDFVPEVQRYLLETDPEDRTEIAKHIDSLIFKIKEQIFSYPTYFLMTSVLKWLDAVQHSLTGVQMITRKTSTPELNIEIETKSARPDDNGYYHVMAKVSNTAGSIRATDVKLEISSRKIIDCVTPEILINTIEGGSTANIEFVAKLDNSVLDDVSWVFAVNCSYQSDGERYVKLFNPLQVHLSLSDSFIPIEKNPYTYGPALKYNDPTFFGRKTDIDTIIDTVLHPQREGAQIIVYGQKRCGKSSLVEAVKSKLENDYASKALCVYLTLRIESNGDDYSYTEAQFYLSLLRAIRMQLATCGDVQKPIIKVPSIQEFTSTSSPTDLFSTCIMNFKQSMKSIQGWEERRLVMVIDEFTVLYNSIKKRIASEEILHHWKGIQESSVTNFATIFVGHDITPTFFAEPYASNAAAIIEKYPLSYLDQNDAIDLIVKPISIQGKSRFEEKAIKQILYYTSASPSYLQIYMKEMVNYINDNEIVTVSEIDAYNVAQRFITKQSDAFASIKDFDNLINSGLEDRFCLIKDAQFELVLRAIARHSKDTDWCERKDIVSELGEEFSNCGVTLNDILTDLDSRKVIERKENNEHIKIKVGLFKEWLIRN